MEYKGLDKKEAEKRLQEYGPNEIREIMHVSPLQILLRQIKKNFIVYLLLAAMIISFFVGKTITAYTILAVIIIIITVGFIQEYKAEKAISALKKMIMPISLVIRNGKETEIPSKEIVPGDLIILRTGEKIPADCLILYSKELRINEAVLTGESQEIKKLPASSDKIYKKENQIFMGTYVVNGKCTAKVLHTGMNTEFGKIAGMISVAEKELPLQKKVNKIVKYMAFLGTLFALIIGAIMILRSSAVSETFLVDTLILIIAVAVASFPEGFPVVLITSLASGAYRMAKKNAIVNRMSIIETLGETTVICSDKTGTITTGEMTVKKIFCGNKMIDVTGAGYEDKGEFILDGKTVLPQKISALNLLLKAGVLCNDSRIEREGTGSEYNVKGTPTEAAILIAAAKAGIFREDINFIRKEEIPFNSERKTMSVICKENGAQYVYSKGAPEVLLKKCTLIQKEGGMSKLTEKEMKKILEINNKMTSNSLRTLAIAYKKYSGKGKGAYEEELIFLGLAGMEDPPREEVKIAIGLCKSAGIQVKMITGDNKDTALAIAKQIGLEGGVLEGSDLNDLTDDELKNKVKDTIIFARVTPEHKLRIVKALKQNSEIVTMTGDGVNDAPALKEAHIGVAMGKTGTDVSREVADLILKDDNFATIVEAIKEGRTIFTNIQKFSTYQISINFSQVGIIFFAVLLGLPPPLIAMQILFMNLFSDEITALTLAFNPYSKDVMAVKPRKNSGIITKPLFFMLIISGLIITFGSLGLFYYALSFGKSEVLARTIAFTAMVFFGTANAFNFRSFRKLTISRTPFSNKALVYGSLFVIATTLLILYFKPINFLFETMAVSAKFLLLAFLVSLSVIVIIDVIKLFNNKYRFLEPETA